MEEKEGKQRNFTTGQVILIVFLTVVITLAIFLLGYKVSEWTKVDDLKMEQQQENVIKNESNLGQSTQNVVKNETNLNQSTQNAIKNEINLNQPIQNTVKNEEVNSQETENNSGKNEQQTEFEKIRFTISSINETQNGYTISAHILEDEIRKVSKQEYDNVLNGGTIKFRGREWVYSNNDDYTGNLKEKNGKQKLDLYLFYNYTTRENEDYYAFHETAGKTSALRDYKSNEITTFNVAKDIKVGDTFHFFEYDVNTSSVKVRYNGEYEMQDENITKAFLDNFKSYDTVSTYGECEAYMINGKIVAIKTFRTSG